MVLLRLLTARHLWDVSGVVRNDAASLINPVSMEEAGEGKDRAVDLAPWKRLTLFWEINICGVGEECGRS